MEAIILLTLLFISIFVNIGLIISLFIVVKEVKKLRFESNDWKNAFNACNSTLKKYITKNN